MSTAERFAELLRTSEKTAVTGLDELLALYEDRFALDFADEDWAASYRDLLHVSLLAAAERAVRELGRVGAKSSAPLAFAAGHSNRSNADALELTLLRLYRQSNAQAAVAEQTRTIWGASSGARGRPPPLEGPAPT